VAPTVDDSADEPGPLEHLYVLRGGGQRHGQRPGKFAHGQLAIAQPSDHVSPSAVGKRVKDRVYPRQFLNHKVERYRCSR
jgi:hypothetical protein